MSLFTRGWGELLGRVCHSLADLLRAELYALQVELGETGRHLAWIAALAAAAGVIAFWASGVFLVLLTLVLATWLPLWGSVSIVLALLLVALAVLALVIRARSRQMALPANVIRARVADHVDFWRRQALASDGERDAEGEPTPGNLAPGVVGDERQGLGDRGVAS